MKNYTLEEVNAFIAGMQHASRIISDTGRGVIQSRKINKEAMSLTMLKQKKVVTREILTADEQLTMNMVDGLKPMPKADLDRFAAGLANA